jgi:hypothetical protein
MILKINPADVVSIPTDYDGAKGRCMKYEVVAEVDGDPKDAFAQVVDKKYAPSTTKLNPMSAWPFATSPNVTWPTPGCTKSCADCECDEDQLYDLVRVYGGWTELGDLTLEEARDKVAKNASQKKAMLKIVKAGTDEEVQ